jgi:hypothetical protein
VVVDNEPGAGGTIGADIVAKAPADGYTILMATELHPLDRPGAQPEDALRRGARLHARGAHRQRARACWWWARDFPAPRRRSSWRCCKRNPGRYNFGSSGIGTYPHLSAEMFKWRAGGLFVGAHPLPRHRAW